MEKRDENYQKKAKTKEENQKEEEEKHIGNWKRKNLEREGKMTKSM